MRRMISVKNPKLVSSSGRTIQRIIGWMIGKKPFKEMEIFIFNPMVAKPNLTL
jgi:hypothetical protein